MPIHILPAPPASGKTTYCIQAVLDAARIHPDCEIWVLSPDGNQALAFRRMLAAAGGTLGVQVVSFNTLLREILEMAGQSIPLAPPALQQAFIRSAIEMVYQEGGLRHYTAIRQARGFVSALEQCFAVLKRGLVYPDMLSEYARSQNQPLQELAAIYSRYQAMLRGSGWADPEGLSWLAVAYLEINPDWTPGWPLMVLDGFDSFTRPQLRTLELLKERVERILITLPGSPAMQRPVYSRFATTLDQLMALGAQVQQGNCLQTRLQKSLAHLEGDLQEPDAQREPAGDIQFLEARSPADEAREALRWIKNLVVRHGLGLNECAIILADPPRYLPHLQAAADEFGLPLSPQGQPLHQSSAYAALHLLLRQSLRDFPRRDLLDTLRSPYFDLTRFGLSAVDAGALDLLSHKGQVAAGRSLWLESLAALRSQLTPDLDLADEDTGPRLPSGSQASALHGSLSRLFDRVTPVQNTGTFSDWVGWVEDLLEELGFWTNPLTPEDQDARDNLRQMLREIVLAGQVCGGAPLNYAGFLEILQQTAEQTRSAARSWLGKPAVPVLRIIDGRGLRHQAVAVLGLSEGIFPVRQRPDPFLDETTRTALQLESAFDLHQLGLFYQAVTCTDQFLLLTRPYLAADGEAWQPSPYWDAALRLFNDEPQQIVPEKARPLAQAGSPAEILAWAAQRGSIPRSVGDDLLTQVGRVKHGRMVLAARQPGAAPGPYHGQLDNPLSLPAVWSASRLESYVVCPHMYFHQRVLALPVLPEPQPGMDALQRGSLLHRILERVYRETPNSCDLAQLTHTLEFVAQAEFEQAPAQLGFRPGPLWVQEQAEIMLRLTATLEGLQAEGSEWCPHLQEAHFGFDDIPPLILELEAGAMCLRGVIDRVDRREDGRLRIIDYKSGSSKLTPRELESGERLQLPLYAMAARDALKLGDPVEGFYWAVYAARAGALRISSVGFDEMTVIALAHANRVLEGVSRADFTPHPPASGCPAYCSAAAWCWSYKAARSWS